MYLYGGSKASGEENHHLFYLDIPKLQWGIEKPVSTVLNELNPILGRRLSTRVKR